MKNYALLAIAAVGMLAACSKNEATPQPQPEPVDPADQVAVQFGLGAPAALTKATGTVGDLAGDSNVWNRQTLYVFGFDREITDFTNAASTNPLDEGRAFIWHVPAEAPDGQNSGSIEVLNQDPDADGQPNPAEEAEPFYYQGNTVYDFYGYHIDDAYFDGDATSADPVPVVEANRIYVPFKIDGGQDLMLAKADPAADILGTEVVNWQNAYSAYAARRGVQPDLVFQHQLARFTFDIKPGSASANDIQVVSLALKSKTTGNLVVVSSGDVQREIADVEATEDWLYLRQRGVDGNLVALDPVGTETFNETPDAEQTSKAIGESILAIPGEESYSIQLALASKDEDQLTEIPVQEYLLEATKLTGAGDGATTFEKGKSYKVTMIIYGLEEVQITATLEAWQDGGETVIDPDEPKFPEE